MPPAGDRFVLWAMSDAHVGSGLIKGDGRRSIAEAIEQSEGLNAFDWDVAVNLGDFADRTSRLVPPCGTHAKGASRFSGALIQTSRWSSR
jgi:hypothetical protein